MDYTSGGNKYDDNGDDDELQDDGLSSSHPAMAFAARQKRKGWQGEELELEHRRQQMMKPPSGIETITATAVDLNQFRNTEVGEGYQAKHVVRQRTAPTVPVPFSSTPTMTNPAHSRSTIHTAVSTKTNYDTDGATPPQSLLTKEAMLTNTGLREFRKEIEKILSSS
ncbi:hypothetical protein IV203_006450 [Nitzschia inconspicua]|uniref:Uncharacterized protein n=1 Tax=Nitzschia inconspicua TaxID=303405 RepID=A0A9K3PAV4_9STRA|nr:hypothetical protein IV203_006450 [Nitzschia inconspicua]